MERIWDLGDGTMARPPSNAEEVIYSYITRNLSAEDVVDGETGNGTGKPRKKSDCLDRVSVWMVH